MCTTQMIKIQDPNENMTNFSRKWTPGAEFHILEKCSKYKWRNIDLTPPPLHFCSGMLPPLLHV